MSYESPSSASLIPAAVMNMHAAALGGIQGAGDNGSANEVLRSASVDFFDRRIGGDDGLNGLTVRSSSSVASPGRWVVMVQP